MRILVLGGTGFVGRHLATMCLARGHAVTLFHRGLSNPAVLPEVIHVKGDRNESFAPLHGRPFDIVFDTGGYEVVEGDVCGTSPKLQMNGGRESISVYIAGRIRGVHVRTSVGKIMHRPAHTRTYPTRSSEPCTPIG